MEKLMLGIRLCRKELKQASVQGGGYVYGVLA